MNVPGYARDMARRLATAPAGLARRARAMLDRLMSGEWTEPVVLAGRTMGTYYRITVVRRPSRADPQDLLHAAAAELARVEALMSAYRPDSDVGRFNSARHTDWMDVSPETARCVALAIEIGRRSEGAYDVTAAPLVNAWGFGPDKHPQAIPEDALIAEARGHVGVDLLEVRPDPPGMRKTDPAACIDLASVAKGFGVDLAAAALDAQGVIDYCIEVGGEVRTRGRSALDIPWRVAIEAPSIGEPRAERMVSLRKGALATSGDYRIYFEADGVRYSHTIDPRTGRPIQHALASVSVADASCARADAWATALLVAGPEQGYALAVRERLAAMFISRTPNGFAEIWTPGFGPMFG